MKTMIKQIPLYIRTLMYLKPRQITSRIIKLLNKPFRKNITYYLGLDFRKADNLEFSSDIMTFSECKGKTFRLINIEKQYDKIDWNDISNGKLWCYNLNYFEYLDKMSEEDGLSLIRQFINDIEDIEIGMEPYPISLRGLCWIRFFASKSIKDKYADKVLYAQYRMLADNFETHLMGNHLLENAFSLFVAAIYFDDACFYRKAEKYLIAELEEEILPDGGHFELSPMYHQIILWRLLDCINITLNNKRSFNKLLDLFIKKAEIMTKWLMEMTFENGRIPLFNDCAEKIAPDSQELFSYAARLGLAIMPSSSPAVFLKDSGYVKFRNDIFELAADFGKIGPDYIPGHGHCDIFNFELYCEKSPLIVDTGTCTYSIGEERNRIRSTSSHNTVTVGELEQSEVWSAFRVAARAKVFDVSFDNFSISGGHDGYKKKLGATHSRKIVFDEKRIQIFDDLSGNYSAKAFFHFFPETEVYVEGSCLLLNGKVRLNFSSSDFEINKYFYSPEFNVRRESYVVSVKFSRQLKTDIIYENS